MDDNAVGSCELNKHRCRERIGVGSSANLSQRRNVVDIYTEPRHRPSLSSR
jgi:hypothetical protein